MRKDAQPEMDLGEERKDRNLFIYSGRTQNNKIISLPAKGIGSPVEAISNKRSNPPGTGHLFQTLLTSRSLAPS